MPTTKVAISIDTELLRILDELVKSERFPNRSKAIQQAVEEHIKRFTKSRLALELAKLDKFEEQKLAEEGMESEVENWPEY